MQHHNQRRETRFEPRDEDPRISPYREQYDRPRDISPQRFPYNRALDPRANPHSEVYDPRFNPDSPRPEYHNFPQPQYRGNEEREHIRGVNSFGGSSYGSSRELYWRQHAQGQRHYEDRPDRRRPDYDDYYRREPPHQALPTYFDHHSQQPYHPPMQYKQEDFAPRGGYDEVQPAGRANKYSTRITDLLTSIREPETKDDTLLKTMEEHKGYLVMMRFKRTDLAEIINAIHLSSSTLMSHSGYCIGFAEPNQIHVVTPSNQMMANDQGWSPYADYAVCLFWFKDFVNARSWFQTGNVRFKQPDFPNSNSYQVVAVPLTYGSYGDPVSFGPESDETTILWSEYPMIYERYTQDFLENYSDRVRAITKRYGGNPYVSASRFDASHPKELNKFGTPGYAVTQIPPELKARVGRSWKNGWVNHGTYITVSTFPTMEDVIRCYNDSEFTRLRHTLSQYADPVVVAVALRKVSGTSK